MTYQSTATLGRGLPLAIATAGPSFALHLLLTYYYEQLPAAVPVDPNGVGIALLAMIPITGVGALIAIIPCLVGALGMAALSNHIAALRHPVAWTLAGGAMGALFCLLFQVDAVEPWVALVGTSALCGRLCWIGAH